ncbi:MULTISPECIES: Com family DNA-binding transcriptional regulator [Pseudomonadota]|uniref:Com family DNA-binding transcriptional regulator n=1 Tax=Aeromonas hydrophila TaxID=644 RepID=A0ABD7G0X3_AERHY|nr:Com family DNA-binding transcriptional regulator [Achromobacter sp. Marseille-Q0513]ELQ8315408.1 Com family DNA-binding transcriptional regulator [Pseudomonas aeruginosa]MBR8657770.1 Com family DNA-binding transcriptional regulator [Achromobacter sp. Marseille-Q0513]RCF42755.1 Com family DNA-binding transcriptional regulator [Aeromonas hydrophila]
MREIRCAACSRKLGEGVFTRLVIKCPRCRALNVLKAESLPPERRRASSIERMPDGRLQESEGAGPLR